MRRMLTGVSRIGLLGVFAMLLVLMPGLPANAAVPSITLNQLTQVETVAPNPSVDGSLIYYLQMVNPNGAFGWYVMNRDGTNQHPIAAPMGSNFGTSHDGKLQIEDKACPTKPGAHCLYSKNLVTSVETQLSTPVVGSESGSSWASDDSFIAFTTYGGVGTTPGLYIVSPDGTGSRLVVPSPANASGFPYFENPSVSPDGTKIVFGQIFDGSPYQLTTSWVVGVDGMGLVELHGVNGEAAVSNAAWFPNSSRIAATVQTASNRFDIESFTLSGQATSVLTQNSALPAGTGASEFTGPNISPDGNWIVARLIDNGWCDYNCSDYPILLMRADGSDQQYVGATNDGVYWMPNSPKPTFVFSHYVDPNFSTPYDDRIFSASINDTPTDTTPPVVTGAPDRAPNGAGWYNAPVTVTWSSVDPAPSSGTPTTPAPSVISTEGTNQSVTSAQSCDTSGNCATGTYGGVKLDSTPPTVTATVSGSQNAQGSYIGTVMVHYVCTDALSGVATCPADVSLTSAGANQSVSRTATDVAGNVTPVVVSGINIATPAPSLTVTTPQNGKLHKGDPVIGTVQTAATITSVSATYTPTGNHAPETFSGTVTAGAITNVVTNYTYSIPTPTDVNGRMTVTITVTDSYGQSVTSAPVSIVVN